MPNEEPPADPAPEFDAGLRAERVDVSWEEGLAQTQLLPEGTKFTICTYTETGKLTRTRTVDKQRYIDIFFYGINNDD